jgi:hypothetical protein
MLQFLVNKTWQKKGATMIELMAMITIVGLGIWSMFSVVTSGMYFAKDTEDTIKAINLAREWLEWVSSIRNTNWLRFSSDRTNCWKIDWYDSTCIWNTSSTPIYSWSSILYTVNWLWYLSGITLSQAAPTWATWQAYYTTYRAVQDSEGFSNQTGSTSNNICNTTLQKSCQSIFTREIVISPVGTGQIHVKSIVRWNTKRVQKVELETILTNWKAKF